MVFNQKRKHNFNSFNNNYYYYYAVFFRRPSILIHFRFIYLLISCLLVVVVCCAIFNIRYSAISYPVFCVSFIAFRHCVIECTFPIVSAPDLYTQFYVGLYIVRPNILSTSLWIHSVVTSLGLELCLYCDRKFQKSIRCDRKKEKPGAKSNGKRRKKCEIHCTKINHRRKSSRRVRKARHRHTVHRSRMAFSVYILTWSTYLCCGETFNINSVHMNACLNEHVRNFFYIIDIGMRIRRSKRLQLFGWEARVKE